MRDLRWPTWAWALVGACLVCFAVLTAVVGVTDGPLGVDTSLRASAGAHATARGIDVADAVTSVFSPTADVAMLVLVALAVGIRRASVRPVLVAAAALAALVAVVLGFKYGLGRPSPVPLANPHGGSYPSGHTAATLVCYGTAVLLLVPRRRWPWALVAAATVAVATALVYARYHWLTDVVASVLFGVPLLAVTAGLGGGPDPHEGRSHEPGPPR